MLKDEIVDAKSLAKSQVSIKYWEMATIIIIVNLHFSQ